jgi:hypothetical protein
MFMKRAAIVTAAILCLGSGSNAQAVGIVEQVFSSFGQRVNYDTANGLTLSPVSLASVSYTPASAPAGLYAQTISQNTTRTDIPGTGTSTARADLASAMVGIATGPSPGSVVASYGSARFEDIIHAQVGGPGTGVVTVQARLDGTVTGTNLANILEQFVFGGLFDFNIMCNAGACTFNHDINGVVPPAGWLSYSFSNESASGFDFVGSFNVTNGQVFNAAIDLFVQTDRDEQADFLHSASIVSLDYDHNLISLTSDSGVFLSTPVPAAGGLFGSGLGLLGWLHRKRSW